MTDDQEQPELDSRIDAEAIALDPDAAVAEGIDDVPDETVDNGAAPVGTSRLREVIRLAQGVAPHPSTIRSDAIAGTVGAIGGVPDGMAAAVLAGLSPISGLYASAIGPIVGGLLVASPLLVVTSTSAGALSGGEAVGPLSGEARAASMYLLVVIVGLVQLLAGVLRLGRLTHFVSHSVMVGFLTGVASLIVLGQFGPITGTDPSGGGNLAKAVDVVTHPSLIQPVSLVLGAIAIGITIAPIRGGLAKIAPLIAIAIPALLAYALNLDVETVKDVGEISAESRCRSCRS